MKKTTQTKQLLLEQLRKNPILQIACEKSGVSRMTYYRWKNEDKEFSKQIDEALLEGQSMVNDLAESQLISAVKDRNIQAIMHWLRHHHPTYANTLQIKHTIQDESLSPEQEVLVREALRLASLSYLSTNQQPYEPKPNDPTRTDGSDDKRPKDTHSRN